MVAGLVAVAVVAQVVALASLALSLQLSLQLFGAADGLARGSGGRHRRPLRSLQTPVEGVDNVQFRTKHGKTCGPARLPRLAGHRKPWAACPVSHRRRRRALEGEGKLERVVRGIQRHDARVAAISDKERAMV